MQVGQREGEEFIASIANRLLKSDLLLSIFENLITIAPYDFKDLKACFSILPSLFS